MGGKSSDPPNVMGAAEETGIQNIALNEAQTIANRPNQYNAWGSTQWVRNPARIYSGLPSAAQPGAGMYSAPSVRNMPMNADGKIDIGKLIAQNAAAQEAGTPYAPGSYTFQDLEDFYNPTVNEWTQIETLNPQLQASLDAQMGIQRGRSELAADMFGRVAADQGTPMDFDQFGNPISYDPAGARTAAEDAAYARATRRLDPQFQSREQQLLTRLRNQGLSPGDQAYDAAMANFGRERTDAYEMARAAATGEGRQEAQLEMSQNQLANALRSQAIEEAIGKRGFSLQELNQMLKGQMVEGSAPSTGGATDTDTGE